MKNFLRKYHKILLLFLLLFASAYSMISVFSHNQFQTFGWDLGFFDQIIWKASQGDIVAYSTIAHENLLADHFQPVLYLLAPVYLIYPDVRAILIIQSFIVVAAALPVYEIARKITGSVFFSFALSFSYLLFLGTQWTILNEFHQTAFLPLFLGIFFYSLINRNNKLYWLSILGILSTKEEYALLVCALGIFVIFKHKKMKMGILTFILGVFSFFFLIYFLMPRLSVSGTYRHVDYGEAGYMPLDVFKKAIKEPLFVASSMVTPSVKIKTVFDSFFAFGFMPLLDPVSLIPVFENFLSRFIYAGPQFTKWVNVNHHAAPLGILLSVATLYTGITIVKILQEKYKIKKKLPFALLGIYLIGVSSLQNLLLHGPINSIFKPQLYQTQPWVSDNYAILKIASKLPADVPVAAQNSLVPHLSQRDKIYLLPQIRDAQYIVVDMHDGPNKYAPYSHNQMIEFINKLIYDGEFKVEHQQGEAFLIKKIN